MKFLSNYDGDYDYNLEFDVETLANVGIVLLIFVIGLLILLALFFIANRNTLNKNSKNYINNSGVTNPNIVDVQYEINEGNNTGVEKEYSSYNSNNNYINNYNSLYEKHSTPQSEMTEQEFLSNLYRKKYNGEISESEFNAALARYRNTKDDFND